MKKTLFFATLVAASLFGSHVMAQSENRYAAELEFTPVAYTMDSLRAANPTNEQLLVELKFISENVKKDATNIKKAQAQLKDERTLLKNLTSGMKDARKHIDASDNLIRQQGKELDGVIDMLEKQLGSVHKSTRVSKAVRNHIEDGIEQSKHSVKHARVEIDERLRKMADLKKSWEAMSDKLVEYSAELNQKEATLNQMTETNKQQSEQLKLEIKTLSDQIKAEKK